MKKIDILRIRRFIIQLGKTLHEYGTPAHRLELVLVETTQALGLKGDFLANSTSLTFVISVPNTDEEYTHIARVNPSGLDLNRLASAYDLVQQVLKNELTLDQGLERLNQIRSLASPYPLWLEFLAWGLASASFAALCGADLYDVIAATLAGWLVFFLSKWAEKVRRVEELLEPISALLIAFMGTALAAYGFALNVPIIILAGIIMFIPGLSLTIGLRELAARHLMAGTGRIMDASMTTFKLYFGAVFGMALGGLLWGTMRYDAAVPPQDWTQYLDVLGLTISLLIVFRIRWQDAGWGLLAGIIGYSGALLGISVFGPSLGGLVGALIVGLYANSFALIKNRPTATVLLPGLVLLVPGSKVYMGLNHIVSGENILATTTSGAQVFLGFMSIVAGLMFANVILPPRKRL